MPAAAHNRVIVQGTLQQSSGGGSEIFAFGWADMSALSPAALAAVVDTVTSAQWSGAGFQLGVSSKALYTGVRVEAISAAGTVTSSFFKPATTSALGLNGSLSCTILCQAISLETGQRDSKGTLIRGRMYPPAAAAAIVGATTSLTDATAYNTAWRGYLHAMVTGGSSPAVASSTSVGLTLVTGTSTDTVVDTQRRRKNRVTGQRSPVVAIQVPGAVGVRDGRFTSISVTLSVHTMPRGDVLIRGVLWATQDGTYGSRAGVSLRLPPTTDVGDAEELLAHVWPLLHGAVYSS